MDREDGEMSEDEPMPLQSSDKKPASMDTEPEVTLLFRADKAGLVIETLEKVDACKLEERAQRFGIDLSGKRTVTQKQIDELYSNIGVKTGNERHFRFDTLHLSSVDGLTTKEIFEYLEDFKPISLEWVDISSCNVVCQDHITAALALLVHSREIKNEDLKNIILNSSDYHWREGLPHHKKDLILMRFATRSDKKQSLKKSEIRTKVRTKTYDSDMETGKNPWGDLCQSWGVYDHQEILARNYSEDSQDYNVIAPKKPLQIKNKNLAKRLGKRNHSDDSDDSSDSEWTKKQKAPRMRMHADDEESNKKIKQQSPAPEPNEEESFAPLSIEVNNVKAPYAPKQFSKVSDKFKFHNKTMVKKESIHSRLGAKVTNDKTNESNDDSDKSDHYVMSRVQKVTKEKGSSVWSRLDIERPSEDPDKDLRHILKSKKQSSDLRDRISKPKESFKKGISLRVEIDNDYHRG